MSTWELGDLFDEKRDLEEKIKTYFDDDVVFFGDRGYQNLLEQLDDVEQQIDDLL